jgi:hypothetical protein
VQEAQCDHCSPEPRHGQEKALGVPDFAAKKKKSVSLPETNEKKTPEEKLKFLKFYVDLYLWLSFTMSNI